MNERGGGLDMMKGTVRWYDEIKGLGIIVRDDGLYVSVRSSAIHDKFKSLREGQRVQFEVVEQSNVLMAVNVRMLEV